MNAQAQGQATAPETTLFGQRAAGSASSLNDPRERDQVQIAKEVDYLVMNAESGDDEEARAKKRHALTLFDDYLYMRGFHATPGRMEMSKAPHVSFQRSDFDIGSNAEGKTINLIDILLGYIRGTSHNNEVYARFTKDVQHLSNLGDDDVLTVRRLNTPSLVGKFTPSVTAPIASPSEPAAAVQPVAEEPSALSLTAMSEPEAAMQQIDDSVKEMRRVAELKATNITGDVAVAMAVADASLDTAAPSVKAVRPTMPLLPRDASRDFDDLFASGAYNSRGPTTGINGEDADDRASAEQLIKNISRMHDGFAGTPDLANVTPKKGLFSSATVAAVTSFAGMALVTGVSRYALVAGATALGAGTLPAVVAAGIAVAAARSYWASRDDIRHEAAKGETRWERMKIHAQGFAKIALNPKQLLITGGAAMAGATAGQYLVERAPEILAFVQDKFPSATAYVKDLFQSTTPPGQQIGRVVDVGSDVQRPTASVKADSGVVLAAAETPVRVPDRVMSSPSVEDLQSAFAQQRSLEIFTPAHLDAMRVAFDGAATQELTSNAARSVAPAASTATVPAAAPVAPVAPVQPATPAAAVAAATATPVAAALAAPQVHTVGTGPRTLWSIAQQHYGTRGSDTARAVEAIIAANPELVRNPNRLSLGQEIKLPASLDGAKSAACNWNIRPGRRLRCALD